MIHSGPEMCESGCMSQTVFLISSQQIRQALQDIVEYRRYAVKHVLRARIVLLFGKRLPVLKVRGAKPRAIRLERPFAERALGTAGSR